MQNYTPKKKNSIPLARDIVCVLFFFDAFFTNKKKLQQEGSLLKPKNLREFFLS